MASYFDVETNVELKVPGDDEAVEYRVWFDFEVTPGYPARLSGNPDFRYEAVPDDYEITKIQIEISDGIWCDLRTEHFHVIEDELIETAKDFINEESAKY